MKRFTFIFIIMLLLTISSAYADGNPAEAAEHWEKVRQLDQLAERFKAETGFTGEINPNGALSHLGGFEGKFNDIPFSADADTTTFRQACDRIIDKLLPYTLANRSQLSQRRISKSSSRIETEYYQTANGYKVENGGLILIAYDVGRYRFSISNGTVELQDDDFSTIITPEEAEQIAQRDMNDKRYSISKAFNLFYSKEGSDSYCLAYLVVVSSINGGDDDDYAYWIDAKTGCINKKSVTPRYNSDIVVSVKGQYYDVTSDLNNVSTQSDSLSIADARVWIDNKKSQTDSTGQTTIFNVVYSNQKVKLANRYFWMRINTSADTLETNSFIPDQTTLDLYHVHFPDCTNNISHYSPNSYIEAQTQIGFFEGFNQAYFGDQIRISTACTMSDAGDYSPSTGAIRLKDARVHNVVRHELSHHFVHRVVGEMMGTTTQRAMDEGFANYFGGASKGDPIVPQIGNGWDISIPINVSALGLGTIDENSYNHYDCGISLASAWWGLRGNQYFPADGQKNGVDTLLVHSLNQVKDELPVNNTYRFKPRYFYNILMSRVDTDNRSWPFNDKQAAIDSVYSVRGFHFYPKVQSVTSASVQYPLVRESFNVLDSVYVHISNYPQNTYGHVFVVEDRDYLNVGSGGIAIPAPFVVNGNPVSRIFKTDGDGKWAGGIPFSKLLPQGNYDIIVNNMVNPTTPDNILHLAFKNDNIIDGVDGLTGPGFTKTGFGDMVVALDLSSTMLGYADQLTQMVKALEHSMIDSERINVFGFTEGTANQNWLENGITDLIGDEDTVYEATQIDSTAINSVMNSVLIEGNTDLALPFYHGDRRLNNLEAIGNRKNIILLSDGVHFVTPTDPDDFPEYPGNWTHTIGFIDTLITTVVVPDSISCYTICYGLSPEGVGYMRRFAYKGRGAFYYVEQLGDLKLYINQLLCSIRGTAAVVNSIKGIEPGMVQSHEIMVEPQASDLRIVVIGKTDPGGSGISYTLVSPS
jgi:uncharacterized membrane protein YkoI